MSQRTKKKLIWIWLSAWRAEAAINTTTMSTYARGWSWNYVAVLNEDHATKGGKSGLNDIKLRKNSSLKRPTSSNSSSCCESLTFCQRWPCENTNVTSSLTSKSIRWVSWKETIRWLSLTLSALDHMSHPFSRKKMNPKSRHARNLPSLNKSMTDSMRRKTSMTLQFCMKSLVTRTVGQQLTKIFGQTMQASRCSVPRKWPSTMSR